MRPPDFPDLSNLILVAVDHDRDSLELLRVVLKACGADVLVAQTPAGALAHLETAPQVDALITDIAMPAMSGAELVRRARSHPSHRSLPAIALTAFPGQTGAEFNALLVKPIQLDTLCGAVRSAIDARGT